MATCGDEAEAEAEAVKLLWCAVRAGLEASGESFSVVVRTLCSRPFGEAGAFQQVKRDEEKRVCVAWEFCAFRDCALSFFLFFLL